MVLMLIGFAVAEGYWMFKTGKTHGRDDLVRLRTEVKQQRQALKDIGQQNAECRQSVANLEQNREIDQLAYAEVERNLRDYHTEMADLKEELEFYRGIVAPSSSERGLKIHKLVLEKSPGDGNYRYKLMLVQVMSDRSHRLISGKVQLSLEGTQAGLPKTLSLRQVSKRRSLGFKFKYFQNLEGDLSFPDNFKPQKVTVSVKAKGNSLSRTFEWQELSG